MPVKTKSRARPARPPAVTTAALATEGAAAFRRWITDAKLKYGAVAAQLDCSKSYVAMLVNASAPPGLQLAARIETLCGIPCSAWTRPAHAS